MIDESIISQLTSSIALDLSRQLDERLLSKVRVHIPEVTRENFEQYAYRIVRRVPDRQRYPEQYYLDGEILLLQIGEPTMNMEVDEKGQVTVHMNQDLRL